MNKIHIVQQRKNGTTPLYELLNTPKKVDYLAAALSKSNNVLIDASIEATTAFEDSVNALSEFGLDVSVGKKYIRIKDSSANSICASTWGDGTGITSETAALIKTSTSGGLAGFSTQFRGNTYIKSFDEFEKFTGLTAIPGSSNSTGAFQNCTSLTSISLPDSATTINQYAFGGCTSLRSVKNADSITTVGQYAFQNCYVLDDTGYMSPTSVQQYAFVNCYRLPGIDFSRVSSIGANAFQNCISIRGHLNMSGVSGGIGNYAFSGCSRLTDVSLGSGVTSIGQYCFSGDSSLQSVDFGGASCSIQAYAFNGCSRLVSLQNTNNVTSIGNYAFQGCSSAFEFSSEHLTSIGTCGFKSSGIELIDASILTTIVSGNSQDSGVFTYCSKLKSIKLPSITSIGTHAFNGCSSLEDVQIPVIKEIRRGAFMNCSHQFSLICQSLTTLQAQSFSGSGITLFDASALQSIDNGNVNQGAFYNCKSLTTISLPSCKTIGSYVFEGCSSLKNLVLDSLTTIGGHAFQGCWAINSFSFENITSIGERAFQQTGSMDVTISGNTVIANGAFMQSNIKSFIADSLTSIASGASFSSMFYSCKSLSTVSLSSCTSIGNYVFQDCSSLKSVSIPSVQSIGSYCFADCTSLSSITIPDGVTTIQSNTFRATGLSSITLPPSVVSIADNVFFNSGNLTNVTLLSETVAMLANTSAFHYCNKLQHIYVPSDLVSSYKTASNWSSYAGKISAIPS